MIRHSVSLLTRLEKSKTSWMLLALAVAFFLLRLPSLFEPHWYGDEGIYQAIGDSIRNGKLLYAETWDNKPPLLYLIYAFFHSDQFTIRTASLLLGIGSLFLIYHLAELLYRKKNIAIIVAGVFTLLYATPIIEGNIANAENFILFFVLLAAWLMYRLTNTAGFLNHIEDKTKSLLVQFGPTEKKLFIIGVIGGIAFLFKIVALFDFAAMVFFLYLIHARERKRIDIPLSFLKQVKYMVAGFATPFVLSVLFFLTVGHLPDYISGAFLSNFGYVDYGNRLIIPQGLLIAKLLLLLGGLIFLTRKRRTFSPALLFVLTWFAFSLFSAYFSQRSYTHYLLVVLPSFMLLFGFALLRDLKQRFLLALLIISAVFLYKDFDNYTIKKTVLYYGNFIQFVTRQKDIRDYRAFFDRATPMWYDVAHYIDLHTDPNDPVLLWGNVAQIYTMSDTLHTGRYTVAYHMSGEKAIAETEQAIAKDKPKIIAIFTDAAAPQISLRDYTYKLTIDKVEIYERIR